MLSALVATLLFGMPGHWSCADWSKEYDAGVHGVVFQIQVCPWSATGRKVWLRFANHGRRTVSFEYRGIIGTGSACTDPEPMWRSSSTLAAGAFSEPAYAIDDPHTVDTVRVCLSHVRYP